ncbi:RHS repeat-associated core domain-containing protein [Streptomyces griseorubiginosus]|uniref:RHS repeat-associated core domain-containing protein n=1 Tax=Streptomyces griseorubiginosus TaxID=67304 RepID=UPI0033DF9348
MAVTVLDGAGSALAQPLQAPAAVPQKKAVTQAADIASARIAAKLSGKRVEALSERTETSTTWVNKDGSLTTELTAGPVRFKDPANGVWRDVDVDLAAQADGSVAAKAHPAGLKLSGKTGAKPSSLRAAQAAPAADLVTLGQGDEQITLQWRGGLPAPQLDGTRATYVNAVPGADVVVEATRTGFEQFVEVKARPETGFSYALPLRTKGLKVEQQADGSVLFTDKKSKKTAVMPAPVMWDATVDPVSGEHTRQVRVAMKVVKVKGGVDLVITPNADFLADPATKYPVTVDPSTSALSNVFDTYVQQGTTVDWSTDVELDLGNPGTQNTDGTFRTARAFVSWNTAPIADALVTDAKLSLWNFHSGNYTGSACPTQPWEVWSTGAATTSSRWTAQPSWTAKRATSSETRGNASCSTQPDGWINANVTTMVQEWASAKAAKSHMGLRATDEAVTGQWKRVNSANAASNPPKLTVTYNYRPRTGTKQEAGAPFYSYGGAYVVNTATPTLRDTFVDPNGDKVNGTFQIFDSATNAQVGNVIVSPWVNSGQVASVTVPAGVLTNGKTYKFRTSPYDGAHYNTGWSEWKTFTVDTTAPSAPTGVTSTDYPSTAWVKGAGQAGTFTVTPRGTDHNWLEWSLDGLTWTKVATGGSTAAKAISVTPPKDGTHTLQVRQVDKADNKSEALEYTFHAGPGGFVQPSEGESTARRLPLLAEAEAGKYDSVSFSWRRSDADTWTRIPVTDVLKDGQALTSWPVPLVNGKNTALAWNATSTVDPDGSVQIKADFTGPNGAAGSTQPLPVVVDRNADGAAGSQVGPGSVNLLNGDYSLGASDAEVLGLSVSRTASSRVPDKGSKQTGQAPIFGKEWVSGTTAPEVDSGYSHVEKTSNTSLNLVSTDGASVYFTANQAQNGWIPEPGFEELALTGGFSSFFTLKEDDGSVTTFKKAAADAPTWQLSSSVKSGIDGGESLVVSEAVTIDGKRVSRPKRIIGATSAAAATTCEATPSTRGCKVLDFVYATSTTATASALGDIAGQVSELKVWASEPGAANSTAVSVARYAYDEQSRLRQVWDPRISPALKTTYTYDPAGRVSTLTPPGQLPWTFNYGKVAAVTGASDGMLLSVQRPTLAVGTKDQVSGTATSTVVYNVPLTGTTAPAAMGSADVATWGQNEAPVDAAAVFPADKVPSSSDGAQLSKADYARAMVLYMNASGRQVNQRNPGDHITTTQYDRYGNTVMELSAANRALALGLTAKDKANLAELGLGSDAAGSAARARLLATETTFAADGSRSTDSRGPLRMLTVGKDLKAADGTVLLAAGTAAPGRTWTTTSYDAGRPTDGSASVVNQPTKETVGAELLTYPGQMADGRVTTTEYDWAKGLATKNVQDPGGLAITRITEFDDKGRAVKSLMPKSNGTDPGTQLTTYWSATGTGTCAGRPEWADQVCEVRYAGAAAGTNGALPVIYNEYNVYGQPAKVVESANGATRTLVTTYDAAGRQWTVTTAGTAGTAIPDQTFTYDTEAGHLTKTSSTTAGVISRSFDVLGRQMSYTDADTNTTAVQYDQLNRPVKSTDGAPSTVTYAYDTSAEPRGLLVSLTDSVAGTFHTSYDADGNVATEKLPGGYTMTQSNDPAGKPTERAYTRDSDGALLLSDAATVTAHDQWANRAGGAGRNTNRAYGYDTAGRLTSVEDTADSVCTRRSYVWDKHSNRTSTTTAAAAPGLDCPTTGGTAVTSTYDTADRRTDSGYVYDAFGRATTVPGEGTLGYYLNDLVRQQQLGDQRQTWALDATRRIRSWTVESNASGSWTTTATKVNHYSSDSDKPTWIVENATTGAITRNVESAGRSLGATTSKTGDVVLQLVDLHNDVSLALPLDTSKAPTALTTDEFGKRTSTEQARYGFFGGEQRSADTLGNLVLMGVRLYDPVSGRFLQTDPVAGGSCSNYDYVCADPVNAEDVSGCLPCKIPWYAWTGWRSDIKITWSGKWSYTSWRTKKYSWMWDALADWTPLAIVGWKERWRWRTQRGVRCTLLSWSREKVLAEWVSVYTTQYQDRITYRKTYTNFRFSETSSWWTTYRRTYVYSSKIYWGY